MRTGITFIFMFLAGPLALAAPIQGEYLPVDQNPPQTCMISFWGAETKIGLCSSTLIAKSTILTAAHCVDAISKTGIKKVTVECPNGESRTVTGHLKLPASSDIHSDIGVMHVDAPFTTPPLRWTRSRAEENDLVADPRNCVIAGWGDDKDGNSGVLHSSRVQTLETNYLELSDGIYIEQNKAKITGNIALHGDSGGSLICQTSSGEKVLVGVTTDGKQELGFSRHELIERNMKWLSWATHAPLPKNNDLFERMTRYEYACELTGTCLEKLSPQSATLGKDVLDALFIGFSESQAEARARILKNDSTGLEKLRSTLIDLLEKCRNLTR